MIVFEKQLTNETLDYSVTEQTRVWVPPQGTVERDNFDFNHFPAYPSSCLSRVRRVGAFFYKSPQKETKPASHVRVARIIWRKMDAYRRSYVDLSRVWVSAEDFSLHTPSISRFESKNGGTMLQCFTGRSSAGYVKGCSSALHARISRLSRRALRNPRRNVTHSSAHTWWLKIKCDFYAGVFMRVTGERALSAIEKSLGNN